MVGGVSFDTAMIPQARISRVHRSFKVPSRVGSDKASKTPLILLTVSLARTTHSASSLKSWRIQQDLGQGIDQGRLGVPTAPSKQSLLYWSIDRYKDS